MEGVILMCMDFVFGFERAEVRLVKHTDIVRGDAVELHGFGGAVQTTHSGPPVDADEGAGGGGYQIVAAAGCE